MTASGDIRWNMVGISLFDEPNLFFFFQNGRTSDAHGFFCAVCLCQVSFREDGEGEWATEGVQLGGRGSAMGVIGMWTGAEHERSDPLGE